MGTTDLWRRKFSCEVKPGLPLNRRGFVENGTTEKGEGFVNNTLFPSPSCISYRIGRQVVSVFLIHREKKDLVRREEGEQMDILAGVAEMEGELEPVKITAMTQNKTLSYKLIFYIIPFLCTTPIKHFLWIR